MFGSVLNMFLRATVSIRSENNFFWVIKCECCPNIETSQVICSANQLTGFYMFATLALNGLSKLTFLDYAGLLKMNSTPQVFWRCFT